MARPDSASTFTLICIIIIICSQISARQLKSGGRDEEPDGLFEVPDLEDCEDFCERDDCEGLYLRIDNGFRSCELMESFCDCGMDTTTLIIVLIVSIALGVSLLIFIGICCCSIVPSLTCRKRDRSYSPLLEPNYHALMNEEEATVTVQVPSAPPPYGIQGYGSCSNYPDDPPTYADVLKGTRRNSTEYGIKT